MVPTWPAWARRLIRRKRAQFRAPGLDPLAYGVSVDKRVFAIDAADERCQVGTGLTELEAALAPARFFRANRLNHGTCYDR